MASTSSSDILDAALWPGVDQYGSSDSTAGLQAVLNYAASFSSPPPVYLRAGTYLISTGPLVPFTGMKLYGDGITFGTGTSPAAGNLMTVTFGTPFPVAPTVLVTPCTGPSAALQLNVQTITATSFQLFCGAVPAASQPNTFYSFNWHAVL